MSFQTATLHYKSKSRFVQLSVEVSKMTILLMKIVVPLLFIQLVTAYPPARSQLHRPPSRRRGRHGENIELRDKRSALEKLPPPEKKENEKKSQLPPETMPNLPSQLPLVKLSAPLTQANLPTTQQPPTTKPRAGAVPTVLPPQPQAWRI